MQTKLGSLLESVVNVVVGLVLALAGNALMFYLLNIPVNLKQNILIGAFMTVISIARSYTLRRFFNYLSERRMQVAGGYAIAWDDAEGVWKRRRVGHHAE